MLGNYSILWYGNLDFYQIPEDWLDQTMLIGLFLLSGDQEVDLEKVFYFNDNQYYDLDWIFSSSYPRIQQARPHQSSFFSIPYQI